MIRSSVVHALFFSLVPVLARASDDPKLDPNWKSSIEQDLARREYHASAIGEGLFAAPNRAHDLRITFDGDGIVVRPRTERSATFEWGLKLSGVGRAGALERPEAGKLAANGNRIELRRADVVEWYVNDAQGLEQGFTLAIPPLGTGDLVVELAVTGTLIATVRDAGIDFTTTDGAVALRYDHLAVVDANGLAIAAQMSLVDAAIRITIDDRDARYPLTIDPLATNPAWIAESDQASAFFGRSVATAGDVNGDGFSDVIVGAPSFDNGETNEGRAFVYLGSADGLASAPAWTAEGNLPFANFASSVSSAGDVNGDGFSDVIVGAPYWNDGQLSEGGALVYLGAKAGVAQTPSWIAEGNLLFAYFGTSVAGAGDVNADGFSDVIVGAHFFTDGESKEGAAFMYLGSAAGLALAPAWTAQSNQANAAFGVSVASAGDVNGDGFSDVIVGAENFSSGEYDEGRAFVYLGTTTGLAPAPAWTAESDQAYANFGASVASAGDVNGDGFSDVIVGAPYFTHGESYEGGASVYLGSAAGLSLSAAWSVEGNKEDAGFGYAVASAGDVNGDGFSDVLVGAEYFENGESYEGRAYAYLGSAAGVALTAAWITEGNQEHAEFGYSVASAGDVNGDGFSDVIIGAPFFTHGESYEGRAYVYLGGPPVFLPGDRLHGTLTTLNDRTAATFDGVAGMKLELTFAKTVGPKRVLLQLVPAKGPITKELKVELGAKSVKRTLKLPDSGSYTLRWTLLDGTPGAFDVKTKRTLPKGAASIVKTLKPKKAQTSASISLLALPGAGLDVKLSKQKFVGTIGVTMTAPDQTAYDLSSFMTQAPDGTVTLTAVKCIAAGSYTLTVSGYANDKESVKAKVKIVQPVAGTAAVDLP